MFQPIEGDDRLQMKAFTLLRDALVAKTEAGLIDEDDIDLMHSIDLMTQSVNDKLLDRKGQLPKDALNVGELLNLNMKPLAWEKES